jgi:hypothetical protein
MHKTQIITAAAMMIAVVAILGVTVINAKSAKHATIAPASSSIDVMHMMKDAKDLPTQQFDAH